MKNIVIVFLLIFFASAVPAVVVSPQAHCPDKFIGKVASIIPPAVDSPFAVNKIIFTKIKTISGRVEERVFVDILKNGFEDFTVGESYTVSLREGVLCFIEPVNH